MCPKFLPNTLEAYLETILAWVHGSLLLLFSWKGTSSLLMIRSGRTFFLNSPSHQAIISCREDNKLIMNSEGTLKTGVPMGTSFQHVKEQTSLPLLYQGTLLNLQGTVLTLAQVHTACLSITLKPRTQKTQWFPMSFSELFIFHRDWVY